MFTVTRLMVFLGMGVAFACGASAETLTLEAQAPVTTPPACITDKAAFWADMSATSAISADSGATLSQWRDVRETAADDAVPTRYYATPAWTNGGETAAVSYEYRGVNPALETIGSAQRKTLNFHGRSGIYLRLQKNGAKAAVTGVRHFFAVHNPSNWFGSVIGAAEENRYGALFLYPTDCSYLYRMSYASGNSYPLYWERTDLNTTDNNAASIGYLAQSTDLAVDGARVDPFSYYPHVGWQLLDVTYPDPVLKARFESVFFQRYESSNYTTGHRAGGDRLSELIVFTNQLSQAEIASVRAYLNAKWGLPTWRDPEVLNSVNYLVPPEVVTNVDLAASTMAGISVASAGVSQPFAFRGDGTVNKEGEGALVIGASQNLEPFAGTLNLSAGKVYLRGGTPPPMLAAGGATITSEDFVNGTSSIEGPDAVREQAAGGVRITRTTGGDSATFTKAGACPAVISDVDASVRKIVVNGGELTLGKPANVGYRGEVPIVNGDFEMPYHCPSGDSMYSRWAYNLCGLPNSGSSNGWTCASGSAYFQRVGRGCTFADGTLVETAQTADGKKWVGSSAWNMNATVGAGNQILNLQSAKAYTRVTLPTDGCYELSFDLCSRYSGGVTGVKRANATPVAVLFGTSTSDWQPVAYAQVTADSHWTPVKVVLPWHAAGEVLIGFDSYLVQVDCSAFLDNVHLRFKSTEARDTYAIPNGDFEQVDYQTVYKPDPEKSSTWYWSVNYFSLTNRAVNWTFAPDTLTADGLNCYVGLVNPNIGVRAKADWLPRLFGSNLGGTDTHGVTALLMVGPTPTAATTFTPPAGTWRLRQRLQKARVFANSKLAYYGVWNVQPTCDASVTIGGNTTPLGRVTLAATGLTERFGRYDFPTSFTTDGTTPVTLTLSTPGNTTIGVLVDDIELVGGGSVADKTGELVKNGDFEEGSANWSTYNPSKPEGTVDQINNGVSFRKYLSGKESHNYGILQYTGIQSLLFKNHCGAKQDVAFPAAGRYRLRFGLRSRVDSAIYANGYFAVKLWQGVVTNQIAYLQFPYQCNFSERTYLFDVPAAGTYTLGFEGYGPITKKQETTCIIDGVSICRVDWDLPETLALDPETTISLAEGNCASLNLAFTGTNEVRSVRCGGQRIGAVVGDKIIINRATCPELVSGPGTLMCPRRGFTLIIR